MSEPLASKIIFREEAPGLRLGVAPPSAVTGAVGIAERGPIGVPVLCTSWEDYLRVFGGFTPNADLALAAMGFFQNGGSQLCLLLSQWHKQIEWHGRYALSFQQQFIPHIVFELRPTFFCYLPLQWWFRLTK